MPDYNLNGLDNRSFEHIVQAIAKEEIATVKVVKRLPPLEQ